MGAAVAPIFLYEKGPQHRALRYNIGFRLGFFSAVSVVFF
jgi:hypothetical protein